MMKMMISKGLTTLVCGMGAVRETLLGGVPSSSGTKIGSGLDLYLHIRYTGKEVRYDGSLA